VRVLNPSDTDVEGTLHLGFSCEGAESLRLDETPDGGVLVADGAVLSREGESLRFPVPAHGLRTFLLR